MIRALSQRQITTQSCSTAAAAAAAAISERALAVAISSNVREVPAGQKLSAAQFAAITHQDLSQKAEQKVQSATMAEGNMTMQAAADHLSGIPLRSKREYKSMIAAYNASRT